MCFLGNRSLLKECLIARFSCVCCIVSLLPTLLPFFCGKYSVAQVCLFYGGESVETCIVFVEDVFDWNVGELLLLREILSDTVDTKSEVNEVQSFDGRDCNQALNIVVESEME